MQEPQDVQGTKREIWEQSITLFAEQGFDNVSMKAIAQAAGITPASIYNHYASKEDILASIYNYYKEHGFDERPTREEYIPRLRAGGRRALAEILDYRLADSPEKDRRLFNVVRIIWSRLYIDPVASELYREYVMKESLEYMDGVFRAASELGIMRLSDEEAHTFGEAILAARVFTASAVVTDPDAEKWRDAATRMVNLLTRLVDVGASGN